MRKLTDTSAAQWRHSSFSQGADQTCVDVAFVNDDVLIRDSKDVNGPVLRFSAKEWEVFLLGVFNREFEMPGRTREPSSAPSR